MIEYLPEPHLMLVSRGEEEASAFMVMSVMSFFYCAMSTKVGYEPNDQKYLGSLIATTPAGEVRQVARVLRANCPMNSALPGNSWFISPHLSPCPLCLSHTTWKVVPLLNSKPSYLFSQMASSDAHQLQATSSICSTS